MVNFAGFLDLPRELRELVFDYCFVKEANSLHPLTLNCADDGSIATIQFFGSTSLFLLPIFSTNQKMRDEAKKFALENLIFQLKFESSNSSPSYSFLSLEDLASIRHIYIRGEGCSKSDWGSFARNEHLLPQLQNVRGHFLLYMPMPFDFGSNKNHEGGIDSPWLEETSSTWAFLHETKPYLFKIACTFEFEKIMMPEGLEMAYLIFQLSNETGPTTRKYPGESGFGSGYWYDSRDQTLPQEVIDGSAGFNTRFWRKARFPKKLLRCFGVPKRQDKHAILYYDEQSKLC